jgi:hypothetical protein
MILLGITNLPAQSYQGRWFADEKTLEELGLDGIDSDEIKDFDLLLNMSKGSIKVDLLFTIKAEDMTLYIICSSPGSYTRKGNKIRATFDPDKMKFRVSNMKSKDKEVKEILREKDFKKMMLKLVSSEMREKVGEDMKSLSYIAEFFQEFTIEKISDDRLTINVDGDKLRFHRAQ